MILEHRDVRQAIDPSAFVAPSAVVCGDARHVNSVLAAGTVVPIGWIAARDPAQRFSPDPEFYAAHREDRECG